MDIFCNCFWHKKAYEGSGEEITSKTDTFQFVVNLHKANYKPKFASPVFQDQP